MDIKNKTLNGLSMIGVNVEEDSGFMCLDGYNTGTVNLETWKNIVKYSEVLNEMGYIVIASNFTFSDL